MATYFVVSDVHGFYDELIKALEKYGFDFNNQNHILVSCGDLCDRGPDAIKCLTLANDLYSKGRAILIRGNHEDLMEEAICRRHFLSHDYHNKTNDTVYQVTGIYPDRFDGGDSDALEAMRNNELWNTYINSCVDYYEDDKRIFVHGWIPVKLKLINKTDTSWKIPLEYTETEQVYDEDWRTSYYWGDARWLNGMKMWNKGIVVPNKTIFCGHWHTSWGHTYLHNKGTEWNDDFIQVGIDMGVVPKSANQMHSEPFIDEGIVAMDACTAVTHVVNCVKIGKVKKVKLNENHN